MEFQQMSESEGTIMELIWRADEPMTSSQVIQSLEGAGYGWKPSTVWTFLGRLVDKGLLLARRQGKTNYYSPALDENEYRRRQTLQFLHTVHSGSIGSFFAALGGGEALDAAQVEELRRWLREQGGDMGL